MMNHGAGAMDDDDMSFRRMSGTQRQASEKESDGEVSESSSMKRVRVKF